jgi:hypothetical protein
MNKLNREEQEILQVLRERNAYRDMLAEVMEVMPKLHGIQTRLHSGSDAMRDEGHKLWLIHNHLQAVLNGAQYEEVLVNSDGQEIGRMK